MRITFDFEISVDEIKNLLPKKQDNGLDNLIKEIVKTNEANIPLENNGGVFKPVAMKPELMKTAAPPFDAVAAVKTLTDTRTTLLAQRKVTNDAETSLKNETALFKTQIENICKGFGIKIGEERFSTTTIDNVLFIVKFTNPAPNSYGAEFIKQN